MVEWMPSARDQDVAMRGLAVLERQRHAAGVLIDALDARAQRDASSVGKAAEQHVEQFGAMRRVVGRAEMRFGFLPERRVVEALAGVPAAIVAAFGIGRDFPQRFAEAELEQDARGVGGHLNAGAHLAERRGLLVELHIDAALAQRQHRGDAADAAADNENLQTGHASPSCGNVSRYCAAFRRSGKAARSRRYFAPAASRIFTISA